MKIINLAIRRPIAVSMFYLVILFTGFAALSNLPLELIPGVDYPKLTVNTSWPDSSPEAVEAFITAPIEAVANTVQHVRQVDSRSNEGNSTVNLEFLRDTNMDFAALELNEKISSLYEELPIGAGKPQIKKYVPRELQTGRFLAYHVLGNYTPSHLREIALKQLKAPLLGVKGVADVAVYGGQDPELRIEIDPAKMKAYNISENAVQSALSNLNIRLGVGRIYRAGKKLDLVIEMQTGKLAEIDQLIIANRQGKFVRLSDVAVTQLTYQEPRSFTRINGKSTVWLAIEREVGTNIIDVADRVFSQVKKLATGLPPTLQLLKEQDQSKQIRKELFELSRRAALCVLVIFLVLILFLRSFKIPIIILSSIFFSVLLTINLFYFAKIGINLITLAGLALGFGMLVDNSIVVVDNIFRQRQAGLASVAAAEKGTKEVAMAIIAATLTTVVVFIPFLYMTADLRIYYIPFASAVGFSLLASLVVAFTFTSALTAKLLTGISVSPKKPKNTWTRFAWFSRFLNLNYYERYLRWAIHYRWMVLAAAVLLLAGSYYLFDKHVTRGTIWRWGESTCLRVYVRMPVGSELRETNRVAREFENKLVGHSDLKRVQVEINQDWARIDITFPKELEFSAVPLVWKELLINQATQYAGVSVSVYGFGPGFYGGGGSTSPSFRIKVLGYNYNAVKRVADDLGRKLKRHARVREVDTSSSGWYGRGELFEMILRPIRQKLAQYNLTVSALMQRVTRYLQESLRYSRIQFQGKDLRYNIKMQGSREFNTEDLAGLIIHTPTGEKLRLAEVAEISQRKVMSSIVRENQQYQRWVTFEFRGPYKLGKKFVKAIVENTHLPPGYELVLQDFYSMGKEEKQQIYIVLSVSLLLVFMVTSALFESIRQPFAVILTVPLALIGVFLIFYLTDAGFDRNAYIGVILLSGIVVNNSIILVDRINRLRKTKTDLIAAIVAGAKDRLRPILMTSITTIFGLLPLVLFASDKTSMWYSLALATIGGLCSSVLLVLTVIPVVYYLLSDKGRLLVHSADGQD